MVYWERALMRERERERRDIFLLISTREREREVEDIWERGESHWEPFLIESHFHLRVFSFLHFFDYHFPSSERHHFSRDATRVCCWYERGGLSSFSIDLYGVIYLPFHQRESSFEAESFKRRSTVLSSLLVYIEAGSSSAVMLRYIYIKHSIWYMIYI